MTNQFAAVVAICWLAALHQVAAQPVTTPGSVVIRCQECGVINSIREIQQPRPGSTPNLGSESPIGLVIYIPLGRGANEAGSYAGSVGSREWQQRVNTTNYEYTVRMDDGDFRLVQKDGISDLQVGERVRLSGGRISDGVNSRWRGR